MALSVAFPDFQPFSRSRFLDSAREEPQVFFKDVLDAEEDVAEAGLPHQPGQPLAVAGDGRGRRLNGVFELVQPGVDDRAAERLEPPHIKRDVVVHDEERSGATVPRVADVRQDPLEGVGVEVASAHLDNRAEAQKLQSKVQPREVSITSTCRPSSV